MKKHIKKIIIAIAAVVIVAGIYLAYRYNYIPHRKFDADHFKISTVKSKIDADDDGVDDYTDILNSAKEYVATKPKYKSKYYPKTGYSNDKYGVCTDVVATALKNSGYDLMELVNADIAENPKDYDIDKPDKYIDFRRVKNLKVYFKHTAKELTLDVDDYESWQPGDIVIWNSHIGLISDARNSKGQPFVIHNANPVQASYEEDILSTYGPIVGHYRIVDEISEAGIWGVPIGRQGCKNILEKPELIDSSEYLWSIEDKKDYKTKLNIPEMEGEVELIIPAVPEENDWNYYLVKDKSTLEKGKTIYMPKEDDEFMSRYIDPSNFAEYDYICNTNLGIAEVGTNNNFYSIKHEVFISDTPKTVTKILVCDYNCDNVTDIVMLGTDDNDKKRLWILAGKIWEDYDRGDNTEYKSDNLAVDDLYFLDYINENEAYWQDINIYNYKLFNDILKNEKANDKKTDMTDKILQGYLFLVRQLEKEDYMRLKYGLIDLDGDDCPELVVDNDYKCVGVYTYSYGRLTTIMYEYFEDRFRDEDGYLNGLEYSPGNNSIRDATYYTNKSYYCLTEKYGEITQFFIHTDGRYLSNKIFVEDESLVRAIIKMCDKYDYESMNVDLTYADIIDELNKSFGKTE